VLAIIQSRNTCTCKRKPELIKGEEAKEHKTNKSKNSAKNGLFTSVKQIKTG